MQSAFIWENGKHLSPTMYVGSRLKKPDPAGLAVRPELTEPVSFTAVAAGMENSPPQLRRRQMPSTEKAGSASPQKAF